MIKRIDTFIGIDPGAGGGISVYGNQRVSAVKMPKDLDRLQTYLKYLLNTYPNPCAFVENVQAWQSDDDEGGKKYGINKMLRSLNEITASLTMIGIPYVPTYPVSWQSECGLRIKGLEETDTERKNRYKDYAQNCFPEIRLTLATSDAVCLVQFGMSRYKNDPDWVWERIQNNKPKDLF